MSRYTQVGRRQFLKYSGCALGAPAVSMLPFSNVLAQTALPPSDPFADWTELGNLTTQALQLGIRVPVISSRLDTRDGGDFTQIMPAALDLIESLEDAKSDPATNTADIDVLLDKADDLQRRVLQAERNLPDDKGQEFGATTRTLKPPFEKAKAEYRRLFETAKIRSKYASSVNWYVSKLLSEKNQGRWNQVAQELCCPWYFVGIIHAMEAGFNFRSHLHNGDSLRRKTRNIPRNRPPVWNPPNDWQSSAIDALKYDGFDNVTGWSLERTLYRWEGYNGWRSRRNGINTPYLWSFSNQYSKGKFVADNVWDPNAVSKQCGAAVMLKELVNRRIVELPTS